MGTSTVMTVCGPVPAEDLGITLMHEHIFCNLLREFRGDGWLNDGPLTIEELRRFVSAGGRSIVEVTVPGIGRQPGALRRVSEMTGLHIIMGCGLYRRQYYDAEWVDGHSTNQIADWIARDLTEGIDGTGIRSGIIGEIGCDAELSAQEERVFRAAARAHKKTGVTITTHASRWPVGHLQLDLLEEEGVDPRRVIIGHCDSATAADWTSSADVTAYHESLARRGAYVQFDHFGTWASRHHDLVSLQYVMNLIHKGFTTQVLLSHDICFRSSLRAHGGNGYDYLLVDIVPRLRAAGCTEEVVRTLLVENPRRALTGEPAP